MTWILNKKFLDCADERFEKEYIAPDLNNLEVKSFCKNFKLFLTIKLDDNDYFAIKEHSIYQAVHSHTIAPCYNLIITEKLEYLTIYGEKIEDSPYEYLKNEIGKTSRKSVVLMEEFFLYLADDKNVYAYTNEEDLNKALLSENTALNSIMYKVCENYGSMLIDSEEL